MIRRSSSDGYYFDDDDDTIKDEYGIIDCYHHHQ